MLELDEISLRFGGKVLYDEISGSIGTRDRIALVGSNGAGKTTLFRVLLGEQEVDGGKIHKAKFMTFGYLPQEAIVAKGKTVYEEVESAFENILYLQERVDQLSDDLQEMDPTTEEYLETLDMIGGWEHKLQDMEAHRLKSKIETVLLGLGFNLVDLSRDCGEFSGGWQMRIVLAKLLLREPSLLLLDEPTNHLDLPSLRWLEQFLKRYEGAILMISHDRFFLDNLCNRTFELSLGRLNVYEGNYSFYEKDSVLRKELAVKAYRNQQKQIEKTEEFIERFRYKASKAKQVQSRIKALDKVERVEIESEESRIHFRFPKAPNCGHQIVTLEKIKKAYDDLTVFKDLSLKVEKGERVAIVGINGAGKSTLARIIAGNEPIQGGERILGNKVSIAYFAQQQADALDLEKTVLEIAEGAAEMNLRNKTRTVLGAFLFRGDDVFKKVKVLSGGEKCRLALSTLLLQQNNCLILDEPTNHLDMYSKRILQEALAAFDGTLLIVSHDREFLAPIVNKVWDVSKKGVEVHLGSLTDYIQALEAREEQLLKEERRNQKKPGDESGLSDKEKRKQEAQKRDDLKPLKQKLVELEKAIQEVEARKAVIEEKLSNPEFYKANPEAPQLIKEQQVLQEKLEKLTIEWEAVLKQIEAIERSL